MNLLPKGNPIQPRILLLIAAIVVCFSVISRSQDDKAPEDLHTQSSTNSKPTWRSIRPTDMLNIKKQRIPLVNFDQYEALVKEVKEIRKNKLLSFDEFQQFAKEPNTVILDTRSKQNYDKIHIEGALHLPFTEFTESNLRKLIPNVNTRILIYCNNNFYGNDTSLISKVARPINPVQKIATQAGIKSYLYFGLMLALNTPTYINLTGYGYTNIYELNEHVSVTDERIKWGGQAAIYEEYVTGDMKKKY